MINITNSISRFQEPQSGCSICPRLVTFRAKNNDLYPHFHNAPVPAFGKVDQSVKLLIVGLAPGLKGANQTGRPFTGDYAGDLLYATLLKFGFATGIYGKSADDGLSLVDCRITNAVRCVPPENKPTGAEVRSCSEYLRRELVALSGLKCILALGTLSHNALLTVLGKKKKVFPFGHSIQHDLGNELVLVDSYHCSRYNINTGRLTEAMFYDVFAAIKPLIKGL